MGPPLSAPESRPALPAQQALEVIMRTYQQPPYNTFECETLEPSKASTDKLISANALLADGSENSVYPAFAEREQPRTLRRATAPPPHGACGWRAMRLGAWQRRRHRALDAAAPGLAGRSCPDGCAPSSCRWTYLELVLFSVLVAGQTSFCYALCYFFCCREWWCQAGVRCVPAAVRKLQYF